MNYRCSGCGEAYGEAAWRGLALAERIEAEQVARLLSNWPAGFCVEVRRCGACGKTVAAKRAAAEARRA